MDDEIRICVYRRNKKGSYSKAYRIPPYIRVRGLLKWPLFLRNAERREKFLTAAVILEYLLWIYLLTNIVVRLAGADVYTKWITTVAFGGSIEVLAIILLYLLSIIEWAKKAKEKLILRRISR